MLNEQQLLSLEKQSEKNAEIKILLDFYINSQCDGVQAFYTALNKQLLEISSQLDGKILDISGEDKTFDRFLKLMVDGAKIGENMLTLRNGLNGESKKESKIKKGHEGKVIL